MSNSCSNPSQSPTTNRQPSISISHAHGRAFVAAVEGADAPLGTDMELIRPRPAGFVEAYFTAEEQALIAQAPSSQSKVGRPIANYQLPITQYETP